MAGEAHDPFSLICVVDTDQGARVGHIRVEGDVVEQRVIDPGSHRLYAASPSHGEIDVVDRATSTITTHWRL